MTGFLLLIGAGLWLLPAAHPARNRLRWLSERRWKPIASGVPSFGIRSRFAFVHWAMVATVGVATVITASAGTVAGVLSAVACAVLSGCWRWVRLERSVAADADVLAGVVAALLAEHAAGSMLGPALSSAAVAGGRYGTSLRQAGRRASMGDDPAVALAQEPDLAGIAMATALVSRAGVAIADVLVRVRADLVAAQQTRRAVQEAVAGPRASALLLSALPAVGLVMGAALGAHPVAVLLHSPIGLTALIAGVVLDLVGVCWTLRITAAGSGSLRRPTVRNAGARQ